MPCPLLRAWPVHSDGHGWTPSVDRHRAGGRELPPVAPCAAAGHYCAMIPKTRGVGRPTALLLAAILLSAGTPAVAQAPDTASPDRWKFAADLALTSASGNENITVLTSSLNVVHLLESAYELELTARYRYGESRAAVVARNVKGNLKFDFRPEATVSPFLFGAAERDPFRRIDVRLDAGAGAKYTFARWPDGKASVSLAALYSYEDRAVAGVQPPVAAVERDARWSLRVRGAKQLSSGFTLEHTTFYQPVWDAGGDYLLNSETTARMVLRQWIAVTFAYTFERDSTPLPGVAADDRLVKAGVSLQW